LSAPEDFLVSLTGATVETRAKENGCDDGFDLYSFNALCKFIVGIAFKSNK